MVAEREGGPLGPGPEGREKPRSQGGIQGPKGLWGPRGQQGPRGVQLSVHFPGN